VVFFESAHPADYHLSLHCASRRGVIRYVRQAFHYQYITVFVIKAMNPAFEAKRRGNIRFLRIFHALYRKKGFLLLQNHLAFFI